MSFPQFCENALQAQKEIYILCKAKKMTFTGNGSWYEPRRVHEKPHGGYLGGPRSPTKPGLLSPTAMPTQEHRNRLLNEVDITDHSFIEQYNRKRAPLKHLCRCLLANWNPKGNLGKTYEYVLEIADRPSRLGFPEFTLKYVCTVYEQDKIKISTDHYFIEQYKKTNAFKTFMPLFTSQLGS